MNSRLIGFCLLILATAPAWSADDPTPKRVPWTTSHIHGSPDPPKPFVAQRILPKLEFKEALEIVFEPASKRWFALERGGKILSWPHDGDVDHADLVADIKALHPDLDNLYGLAFHPKFEENHQVFVTYTRGAGIDDGTKLSRFIIPGSATGSADTPAGANGSGNPSLAGNGASAPGESIPTIDVSTEQVLLTWRSGGHNGANLQFGPDGMLYISTGDSEVPSPPDPLNTGQDISDLLSSILRIDVDHTDPGLAYAIPKDNPFVDLVLDRSADTPVRNRNSSGGAAAKIEGADKSVRAPLKARPEVWAYGLRNPWKMSFDRATGRLWCGDVGWELWEMIHLIERGGNYGWSAMEASQPVRADAPKAPTPIRPPVVAHSHDEAASITGGHVYHGKKFPELEGAYLYGDWVTGKIWALWHDGKQVARHEEIADTHHKIIAFGQDAEGEMVYLDYSNKGALYELDRNRAEKTEKFPTKLSETGLYRTSPTGIVEHHVPSDGVFKYDIAAKMWLDVGPHGAEWFFLGLPGQSAIKTLVGKKQEKDGATQPTYKLQWPTDAVLAKTLEARIVLEGKEQVKPIETQVLHYDGTSWNGYSYRWDEQGRDAALVPAAGDERMIKVTRQIQPRGVHELPWRFHSRAECIRCHNSWCDTALAFNPAQLNVGTIWSSPSVGHHLVVDDMVALGLVDAQFAEQPRLELLHSRQRGTVSDKARSWLHINCSQCHRQNAGGAVTMMLNHELMLPEMRTLNEIPQQGGLGLANPKLIDAGNPWNSVICVRIAKSGTGHMPIIGPREVDSQSLNFIEDWIARMGDKATSATDLLPKEWNESLLKAKLAKVDGAMQVLRAVDDGIIKEPLRQKALELAWSSPQPTVRDLFDRFLPDDKRVATLGQNPDPKKILALTGDAARGSQLLSPQGKLAACFACHLINGAGREFGPDLSKVGTRLKPEQILESILQPSKVIAQGYQGVSVETSDGALQVGFIVKESAGELAVKTATGQTVTISKSNIAKQSNLPASLMAEGLAQGLTAQEAADLLGFLNTLK